MKKRAARMAKKTTRKGTMRGSRRLVKWKHGVRHGHTGSIGITVLAKVLMVF